MSLRNLTLVLIVAIGGSLALTGQEAKPLDLTALKGGEEVSFEIADGVKMVFCWIPKGKATLGSPETEENRNYDETERQFSTEGFWLAKTECTQKEWQSAMGDNPSFFSAMGEGKAKVQGLDTSDFPVENVSWDKTQIFMKKLGARDNVTKVFGKASNFQLPHEDQWEYAYRGGKGNRQAFYWGDKLNGDKANTNGNDYAYRIGTKGANLERTTTVGSYAKLAGHAWGLQDMSGNVAESCDNLFNDQHKGRVVRGGSWHHNSEGCRAAYRRYGAPAHSSSYVGFRVCVILK